MKRKSRQLLERKKQKRQNRHREKMASGGDGYISEEERARILNEFYQRATPEDIEDHSEEIRRLVTGKSPYKRFKKPSDCPNSSAPAGQPGPLVDADGCEHYEGEGEGLWHLPALPRLGTLTRGGNTAQTCSRIGEPSLRALPPRGVRRPRRKPPTSPEGGSECLPRETPDEGAEPAGPSMEDLLDRQIPIER
ncbi:hypothetical protein V5799_007445 [Amblyomma americanum]|uniref:Uncharacterized protein n=1 Tax=Amblyomma americanum TaxID=6943 RepID=A0AAQ4FG20_AMBAM